MKENKTTQLNIRLTESQMDKIRCNARACDMTVSAFVMEVAQNFIVLNCDYDQISGHSKEISSLRNVINRLVYTVVKTREYVPADLEYILNKMNEIAKSEGEFLELMLDEKEIITTSKLVVCTAPIRGAYWLGP